HATRGFISIGTQACSPALAKQFELSGTAGALVADVTPKSPGEKAGLKSGDIIQEFNGKKVTDSRHLKLEVARTKPGETVPVKILRDGSSKTLQVTVKELPGPEPLAKADTQTGEDTGTLNGVTVS